MNQMEIYVGSVKSRFQAGVNFAVKSLDILMLIKSTLFLPMAFTHSLTHSKEINLRVKFTMQSTIQKTKYQTKKKEATNFN